MACVSARSPPSIRSSGPRPGRVRGDRDGRRRGPRPHTGLAVEHMTLILMGVFDEAMRNAFLSTSVTSLRCHGSPRDAPCAPDGGFRAAVTDEIVERLRAAGCVYAEDEATLLVEEAEAPTSLRRWSCVGSVVSCSSTTRLGRVRWFADHRRAGSLRAASSYGGTRHRGGPVGQAGSDRGRSGLWCRRDRRCATRILRGHRAHAADIDPAAVSCARLNLEPEGHVHERDLFAALPTDLKGRVDIVVVNAPTYPPTRSR